jgi:hypothetical protein
MCSMSQPTLDDAKALLRSLRHRDRMLLIPWLVATFDSTGAERRPGWEAPVDLPKPRVPRRDEP